VTKFSAKISKMNYCRVLKLVSWWETFQFKIAAKIWNSPIQIILYRYRFRQYHFKNRTVEIL